mgnify:CR=1 FL=1
MWQILWYIAVVLAIIYFFKGRNAVWGGLTIGAIVGLIIAVTFVFRGQSFHWHIILRSIVVGTIAGFVAELLGKVSDLIKRGERRKGY